jgi:hypothetical protein
MIGREGLVGINVFLGGIVTPDRAIVQLAGADYAGSRGSSSLTNSLPPCWGCGARASRWLPKSFSRPR